MDKPTRPLALLFASFALLAPIPAEAGVLLLGGMGGVEDPPSPTQGAETEEDWNPTVTCSVNEYGGITDLLYCLLDEIATPPPCTESPLSSPAGGSGGPGGVVIVVAGDGGEPCGDPLSRQDFIVTLVPAPRYGVQIRRINGDEIARLTLRENDPGIQTVELQMETPGRYARIGLVTETPAGTGEVMLQIDDARVTVRTNLFRTALAVNAEIARQLHAAGYAARVEGSYLFAIRNRGTNPGVRLLHFRSTDPGVTRSDLSLLPPDDTDLPDTVELVP